MAKVYARGERLYLDYREGGKRVQRATKWVVGQEREAEAELAEQLASPTLLAKYTLEWAAKRKNSAARNEIQRLKKYVIPVLGKKQIARLSTANLRTLLKALDKTDLAPRTKRHVMDDLHQVVRQAVREGVLARDPYQGLEKVELPKKEDKDPNWRQAAVYELDEMLALSTDERIPIQRRMLYATLCLTGMRIGELCALRWSAYQLRDDLNALIVASSYNVKTGKTGTTKTKRVREVPIHPALQGMLVTWRDTYWRKLYGRRPVTEGEGDATDLIFPRPFERGRGRRTGGPKVAWRQDVLLPILKRDDLPALGLRTDRGLHDMRASFITWSEDCGVGPVFHAVTHEPPKTIRAGYTRRVPWKALCKEMRKLKWPRPLSNDVTNLGQGSPSSRNRSGKKWALQGSNLRPWD
ncbi:MAG: site-specific integrase [Deltaproteobacteria bacterium]|nr:site-specific integrase [Deltaproteobacteria bacterium]